VQPVYVELLKFMRTEYVPGCRTTLAAKDLPDGDNYYRAKIREFTTLEWIRRTFTRSVKPRSRGCMEDAGRDEGDRFNGDFPRSCNTCVPIRVST